MDPSSAWTFEGLSQALTFNGRPQEAQANLDAALRLDPGWNDHRRYLAGIAAFGEGQFEEAAAHFEEIGLQGANPWPRWYGLQALISAYAHLGRSADVDEAKTKFAAVLEERGEAPYTMLRTQNFFVYKNEADIMRLLDGLAKAGIPELPADTNLPSDDRLTGDEIESLILGRELRGRQIDPETAEYRIVSRPDQTFQVSVGSKTSEGHAWVQGNFRCHAFPVDLTSCGAVFRNPGGTGEGLNEYILVHRLSRFEFSVIE